MSRVLGRVYGLVTYTLFLATFLYAIGFLENLLVPKGIDSGVAGSTAMALLVNLGLLSLFAVQHNVMARPWFKRSWTKVVSKKVERTTFVLVTCAILNLMFWQWRPLTGVIWEVQNGTLAMLITGISLAGWAIVLYSTFLIDHADLFGLRQVFEWNAYKRPVFKVRSFYKLCRHPLYLGFMIAFWATPIMTIGHLLFAAVTTVWMILSIQFEEYDLKVAHPEYADYQVGVPMLLPLGRKAHVR